MATSAGRDGSVSTAGSIAGTFVAAFWLVPELGTDQVLAVAAVTLLVAAAEAAIGLAILVVRLEEELGYDPFLIMTEAVYPRTFGEFLDIYERHKPPGL